MNTLLPRWLLSEHKTLINQKYIEWNMKYGILFRLSWHLILTSTRAEQFKTLWYYNTMIQLRLYHGENRNGIFLQSCQRSVTIVPSFNTIVSSWFLILAFSFLSSYHGVFMIAQSRFLHLVIVLYSVFTIIEWNSEIKSQACSKEHCFVFCKEVIKYYNC